MIRFTNTLPGIGYEWHYLRLKAYPNPRNIPGYGKQRGWVRLETKSGNTDETFILVEGTQLEIPFESL